MNLTSYHGIVVSHNGGMGLCFLDDLLPVIYPLTEQLIHRVKLLVGDTLGIHQLPKGGYPGWKWHEDMRLAPGRECAVLYPFPVTTIQLGRHIGYFKDESDGWSEASDGWFSGRPETDTYLFCYEVIPIQSYERHMSNSERLLRRTCQVPDSTGFGSLRGLLNPHHQRDDSISAEITALSARASELYREWTRMNDILCDPTLSCKVTDQLLVPYMKIATDLEKCRIQKEALEALSKEKSGNEALQRRWDAHYYANRNK